jgi:hypothetical protein
VKIWELVKIRVRAQDPGSIEPVNDYISCTPSYMSVFMHVLLLECVQKVIAFMGNALAVQSDLPTPPSIYFRHNWAGLLCLIYIYGICDTPEQMSGRDICILNRPSPPHLPYRHIPLTCKGGRKWEIGHYHSSRMGEIYYCRTFKADRSRFKWCSPRGCPHSSLAH